MKFSKAIMLWVSVNAFAVSSMCVGDEAVKGKNPDLPKVQEKTTDVKATDNKGFEKWKAYRDSVISDPAMVIYYAFDKDTGADIASCGFKSTAVSNAKWMNNSRIPGKNCLSFDGKTTRVKCGNVPVISNLQKTAITVWINVAGKGNSGQGFAISSVKRGEKGAAGWGIRIADFDKDGCKIQYSRQYVGDYGAWVCSTKVELNKWYFLAITYDAKESEAPVFYLNGELQPSTGLHWPKGNPADDSAAELAFGSEPDSNLFSFEGCLDDVVIYDKLLSADEVKKLYADSSVSENTK